MNKPNRKGMNPMYNPPDAFAKKWPPIIRLEKPVTQAAFLGQEEGYQMGKLIIGLQRPGNGLPGYFLSITHPNRYPFWDELAWIRYRLIPDAADMVMHLPNLARYINPPNAQYTFTMDQLGWVLNPTPLCEKCASELIHVDHNGVTGHFRCSCGQTRVIDMSRWNEDHGWGVNK